MGKIAIVYWSGTGNTEMMANEVAEGAKEKGAEVSVIQCSEFGPDSIDQYDAIAFGCPAMGSEELEEVEFEPMFSAVESKLASKPIGLFGSYSWASGEWMELWEDRCRNAGLNLAADSVIAFEAPDDEAKDLCRKLGAQLAG